MLAIVSNTFTQEYKSFHNEIFWQGYYGAKRSALNTFDSLLLHYDNEGKEIQWLDANLEKMNLCLVIDELEEFWGADELHQTKLNSYKDSINEYYRCLLDYQICKVGLYFSKLSAYNEAKSELYKALDLLKSDQFDTDFGTKTDVYEWLSQIFFYEFRFKECVETTQLAISNYKQYKNIKSGNKRLTKLNIRLAQAYIGLGNNEKAKKILSDILPNIYSDHVGSLTNLMHELRSCFTGEEILNSIRKGRFHGLINKSDTIDLNAMILSCKGDHLKAAQMYSVLLEETDEKQLYEAPYLKYISFLLKAGKFSESKELSERLLIECHANAKSLSDINTESINSHYFIIPILKAYSTSLLGLGKDELSSEKNQREIRLLVDYINEYVSTVRIDLSSATDQVNAAITFKSLFDNLIDLSFLVNDPIEHLGVIENAKSYVLNINRVKQIKLNSLQNLKMVAEEIRLRDSIIKLEEEFLKFQDSVEIANNLANYRKEYKDLIDSLNLFEKSDFKKLKTIQSKLKKDESLLSYYLTNENIHILYVDKNKTKHFTKPEVDNLVTQLTNFSNQVASKNSVTGIEKISEILLPKGIKLKPNIIVIPHAELNYFPFDLLKDPNGDMLLLNHNISYNYGFNIDLSTEYEDPSNNKSYFLGVAPIYEEDCSELESLLNNKNEIENICELFQTCKLLFDEEANKSGFLNRNDSYDVIHFACHTVIDKENSANSKIALSQHCENKGEDNSIYVSDILTQNFNSELVVLSSCESVTGKLIPGEGMSSLSKAFFHSNVASIVSTLWKSNDQISAEIMNRFYRYLHQGLPKDEALRLAKNDHLIKYDPDYQEPYYWAGFTLTGDTRPIAIKPLNVKFLMLGLVLSILSIGYFYLKFFKR